MRLSRDESRADILTKRLRKLIAESVKSELGGGYEIEELEVSDQVLTIEITSNGKYSLLSKSILPSTLPTWPALVDQGIEALRRGVRNELRKHDPDVRISATWEPGVDVWIEDVAMGDDAPLTTFQERQRELGSRKVRQEYIRLSLFTLTALIVVVAVLVGWFVRPPWFGAYVGIYAVGIFLMALAVSGRVSATRDEIEALDEQIELRDLLNDEERRAFRLFRLHNRELQRYYDLALSQRRLVFGLGAFCVLLGAAVAIVAVVFLTGDSAGKHTVLVAGLAAVGTILSNFVAVVYLRMFSDTVKSMDVFHTRLVATHHLLFGNLLAARITDKGERDKTLAAMASAVADGDVASSSSSA